MLRRSAATLRANNHSRPSFHRAHSTQPFKHSNARYGRSSALAVSGLVVAGFWLATQRSIHNDGPSFETPPSSSSSKEQSRSTPWPESESSLSTLVWGSNQYHVLSPEQGDAPIRSPAVASWIDENVALRDLAFHEKHAACVDAVGDVYQWGDGFFGENALNKGTMLTLHGKNITHLELTAHRVFALSSSGEVYSLPSSISEQEVAPGEPTPGRDSWWATGWLWGEESQVNFKKLTTNVKLARGEKFISIAAGNDHLVALTTNGRTFAHPFNERSNAFGQLGFRKFDVPDPASSKPNRLPIELTPRSIKDPYAQSTPYVRSDAGLGTAGKGDPTATIASSDRLFEIPSLQEVKVAQIAAGGRTSFARTDTGKVLGWGANEYGQIGLGGNVTLDTITVPTEVVLWRGTPNRTHTRCVNVTAGGDLTCFSVERKEEAGPAAVVDVLMCGNGQWGGLGNNLFSNAQGNPVKAKNVSGLLEYSDDSESLQAIRPHAVSVSPTGHVLLTLDTLKRAGNGVGGRDLMVWGANQASELGNEKKSSLAIPSSLQSGVGGQRVMLRKKIANEVRSMRGSVWKRKVMVEECAVTGYRASGIYWKLS